MLVYQRVYHVISHVISCYHLVMTNIANWKITILNGKTMENHQF
jgi:hypothetical protein